MSKGGDLGHPLLDVDLSAPQLLEFLLALGVGDRLKTGVVVWQCARVTRALNVILAAHWVDASALTTNVAGHEYQIAETLHVINATDVFGNAQRVV